MQIPNVIRTVELPAGRYIKIWATPEALAYCESQKQKPQTVASAALHTLALRAPRELVMVGLAPRLTGLARRFLRGRRGNQNLPI